jgi:hypothetical protein
MTTHPDYVTRIMTAPRSAEYLRMVREANKKPVTYGLGLERPLPRSLTRLIKRSKKNRKASMIG